MDGNGGNSSSSSNMGKTSGSSSSQGPAGQGSLGTEEEDESESESSSTSALSNFRKEWEAELQRISSATKKNNTPTQLPSISPASIPRSFSPRQDSSSATATPTTTGTPGPETGSAGTVEDEAKKFFLMGVSFERRGDLYDAVRYYRRAIQLVPDIEYRVNQSETKASEQASANDSDDDMNAEPDDTGMEDEEDVEQGPLSEKFLQIFDANGGVFFEKNRPDGKTHVSNIPVEILLYILRWVVSNELDLRTLDTLSAVSRGFYCLCRDDSLWKMACDRIWANCNVLGSGFSTYREMFLSRPRARFDGCYISKITYVRPGEHSFQDQSYRPWHMVEYYRYIRFFPDGTVLFLTTAEKPGVTVASLRDRRPRNISTLTGRYHLYGSNLLSAVVTKSTTVATPTHEPDSRRRRFKPTMSTQETNFHMDFEIEEMRGRSNWALRWVYYALTITNSNSNNNGRNNGQLNTGGLTTNFELSPALYPPLYFSRVRSYTTQAEGILE